jgi:hypothetical protein
MGIAQFERFFRVVASIDVDKQDLRRYSEFVNREIHDQLLRGQAAANANGRDIIEPWDLPITKGLQECMHAYRIYDNDISLHPIIEQLTPVPNMNLGISVETEEELPRVAGAISVALAKSFKIIDPELKNPQTSHWDKAFELFDLLL